jgi:hypothetical protein
MVHMFWPIISANRRRKMLRRDEGCIQKARTSRFRVASGALDAAPEGYPDTLGRAKAASAAVSGPLSAQTLIPWRASNAARIGAAGWAGRQMKKLISVRQALEDPAWLGSMALHCSGRSLYRDTKARAPAQMDATVVPTMALRIGAPIGA